MAVANTAGDKKTGRTDAGPNRTTAYKAGVGSIDESGKLVGRSHQQIHGAGGKTGTAHVIGKPGDYKNPAFKNPFPNIGPITLGINFSGCCRSPKTFIVCVTIIGILYVLAKKVIVILIIETTI